MNNAGDITTLYERINELGDRIFTLEQTNKKALMCNETLCLSMREIREVASKFLLPTSFDSMMFEMERVAKTHCK
jgi:hypothetical protein